MERSTGLGRRMYFDKPVIPIVIRITAMRSRCAQHGRIGYGRASRGRIQWIPLTQTVKPTVHTLYHHHNTIIPDSLIAPISYYDGLYYNMCHSC